MAAQCFQHLLEKAHTAVVEGGLILHVTTVDSNKLTLQHTGMASFCHAVHSRGRRLQ